jgi:hypothetical protein
MLAGTEVGKTSADVISTVPVREVVSANFFLLILPPPPTPRPMLYLHKYQFPSYSYVVQLTYVSEVRLMWTLHGGAKV